MNGDTSKPTTRFKYDLTGKEFPHFHVIHFTGKYRRSSPLWLCLCKCDTYFEACTRKIRNGQRKSCGCLRQALLTPDSPISRFQEGTNLTPFINNKPGKTNKSGVVGVRFLEDRGKWEARMYFKKELVLCKTFPNFNKAVKARQDAVEEHVTPLLEKYNLLTPK